MNVLLVSQLTKQNLSSINNNNNNTIAHSHKLNNHNSNNHNNYNNYNNNKIYRHNSNNKIKLQKKTKINKIRTKFLILINNLLLNLWLHYRMRHTLMKLNNWFSITFNMNQKIH